MAAIEVFAVDIDTDLQAFSRLLRQRGVPHRVHEHGGRQVLSVEDPALVEPVQGLYAAYCSGAVVSPVAAAKSPRRTGEPWQLALVRAPLTAALLVGCLLGALVVASRSEALLSALTFQSYFEIGGGLVHLNWLDTLRTGELWRLWTPIFLHFGILHLVFNALWLWEFGRRVEYLQGTARLAWLVLIIGLGSNVTQYYFASDVMFGGMSGVVYGLVGYCFAWSLVRSGEDFGLPRALFYMLIGLMVVSLTGIFGLFGFGAVANAAHFAGFAVGGLLGLLLAALDRSGRPYR